MKCIILNVNTTTLWKGKPISEVILTAARFDRDHNRGGVTRTLRQAIKNIQRDFNRAKGKIIGQQEYVDFVNKFLLDRKNDGRYNI